MKYAIAGWDVPTVPVAGTDLRYPVRHIYCVGRNYAEHAKEMGGDATKEPPFFFTKPADAVVPVVPPATGEIFYPMATKNFHHEIELVVAIGERGAMVAPEQAQALIYGYAVGLDMTRRDLQNQMREIKRPWDIGKSFAQAAPIGPIHPVGEVGHLSRGRISVEVNGTVKQQGDLADMIWDVPHMLHFLSQYYELLPGDLVFTGTPSGVAAVVAGDTMVGRIESLGELRVRVVAANAR
jgi:fumarylpyruvate hydrolase